MVSIASTARGVFQVPVKKEAIVAIIVVSIASTARGVFQAAPVAIQQDVPVLFQSLQQRGGYSKEKEMKKFILAVCSFNRFNSAGGIPRLYQSPAPS